MQASFQAIYLSTEQVSTYRARATLPAHHMVRDTILFYRLPHTLYSILVRFEHRLPPFTNAHIYSLTSQTLHGEFASEETHVLSDFCWHTPLFYPEPG